MPLNVPFTWLPVPKANFASCTSWSWILRRAARNAGGDVIEVKSALKNDAHERLEQLNPDAAINRGISAGRAWPRNPLATINVEAEAQDAHLVVLARESFLRHACWDRPQCDCFRKSVRRPVLVVKQAPHETYRRVVVTVDFSPVSLEAIRLARYCAQPIWSCCMLSDFPSRANWYLLAFDEQVIRRYVVSEGEVRRKRVHELATAAARRRSNTLQSCPRRSGAADHRHGAGGRCRPDYRRQAWCAHC